MSPVSRLSVAWALPTSGLIPELAFLGGLTMPGIVGTDTVAACGGHRDILPNCPSRFVGLFVLTFFFPSLWDGSVWATHLPCVFFPSSTSRVVVHLERGRTPQASPNSSHRERGQAGGPGPASWEPRESHLRAGFISRLWPALCSPGFPAEAWSSPLRPLFLPRSWHLAHLTLLSCLPTLGGFPTSRFSLILLCSDVGYFNVS